MARTDLRALFDEIPDPRVQRTRRHRLTGVLMLVLLGTVVGCSGWDAIEDFAYEREAELRELLGLLGGIPSADTLRRVMARVAPRGLAHALTRWTDALCETYAGKQITQKLDAPALVSDRQVVDNRSYPSLVGRFVPIAASVPST